MPTQHEDLSELVLRVASHLVRIHRRGPSVTGVLVGPDKIIASDRTLREDDELQVTWGDTTAAVEIVGRDPGTDIALLRANEAWTGAQGPTWRAPDELKVAQFAMAVTGGRDGPRVAVGALGVVGGPLRGPGGVRLDRHIEFDRELSAAFAGSLLVDANGDAIGFNVPGLLRRTSLSLPSTTVFRTLELLEQHGRVPRGYLGVGVYPVRLTADVAHAVGQDRAVVVVSLEEEGPASKAGIGVGDVIVAVDTQAVDSPWSLRTALLDRGDQQLRIKVLRSRQLQDLEVPVGSARNS